MCIARGAKKKHTLGGPAGSNKKKEGLHTLHTRV